MNLSETRANKTWEFFRQLSQIPRPSGKCQAVGLWLEKLAKEHNWTVRRDEVGNIVIEVPASEGRENHSSIILQAHMDMVCQKTPDSDHDFDSDPIELCETEGWIRANKTTLGADNGIGLCMALAAGSETTVKHPPLELLFTIDEESGLEGAVALTEDFVHSKRLINLDSEHDNALFVGCAGGEQTDIYLPLEYRNCILESFVPCRLDIHGLSGGHSGINIHEQRANALSLMGYILNRLERSHKDSIALTSFAGGTAHNAIARDCQAELLIASQSLQAIQADIKKMESTFKAQFEGTDPNLTVRISTIDAVSCKPLTATCQARLIALACSMPQGVFRFDTQLGTVETSSNFAIAEMGDHEIHILSSQRSSREDSLDWVTGKIEALTRLAGGRSCRSNRYPGWQPNLSSALLKICQKAYQTQCNNTPPDLVSIHAGLECGIIGEKIAGMDMVSFGPNIQGAHSPTEKVEIASVDKIWLLLTEVLDNL